jgi:glycosyltransferase involved in cell wall biosynthesis
MKLSVIIPCYNAAHTIATQLEALAKQQWSESWELIISDNGSTDQTLTIVAEYRDLLPNLEVVDASDLRGAAHARNVGASIAKADALAFCDADDEVGERWVFAMSEALSRHDFVASRFEVEKLNPPWVVEGRGNPQKDGLHEIWYPPYLPHAGCSGLGVKRALHEAVGGFDESLPFLEETDYCFRIQLRGTELHFTPDAIVHIRFRDTYGGIYRQARNYAEYNVLLSKRYRFSDTNWSSRKLLICKQYASKWIRLMRLLPRTVTSAGRARWVWSLGWQIGRLKGSIKHRVPPV